MKLIFLYLGVAVFFLSVTTNVPNVNGQQSDATRLLTLEEAYGQAVEKNEIILIAAEEIEKSRLSSAKANAFMLPRLNLYAGYSKLDDPIGFEAKLGDLSLPPVTTVPEEQVFGNANLVQPVYQGEWYPRKQQAKNILDQSEHDFGWITQGVLYQVAQAYYEIIRTHNYIKLAEESLERSYEEKRIAEIKFNQGAVTEDAVLSADLKITSSQSRLVTEKSNLRLARYMLNQLIKSFEDDFEVIEPSEPSVLKGTIEDLVAVARKERLDYQSAMSTVEVTNFEMDAIKSRFHPTLQAEVDYYTVDDPAFDQNEDYWRGMLKLRMPLYIGGIRFADLRESKHNLRQAQLRVENIEKNLRTQIEEALVAIETHGAEIESLEKQLDLARKNYDIVFSKYRHGATNNVDVNQAFIMLERVQRDLIARKHDHSLSVLHLERATGLFCKDILVER